MSHPSELLLITVWVSCISKTIRKKKHSSHENADTVENELNFPGRPLTSDPWSDHFTLFCPNKMFPFIKSKSKPVLSQFWVGKEGNQYFYFSQYVCTVSIFLPEVSLPLQKALLFAASASWDYLTRGFRLTSHKASAA